MLGYLMRLVLSKWVLAFAISSISLVSYSQEIIDQFGAIVRSDTAEKKIYLFFSGHDFDEGFPHVKNVLDKHDVKASFFFTGDFVRNHKELPLALYEQGHYVGAHSDKHLLYCDWTKRDSLMVSEVEIIKDIEDNLIELQLLGIQGSYFMPPYEWYNKTVVEIASQLGQRTINFSPDTRATADYTHPGMENYVPTHVIVESIFKTETTLGMNGFHLLIHPGTSPKRTDKLYFQLEKLIIDLTSKGYTFEKLD